MELVIPLLPPLAKGGCLSAGRQGGIYRRNERLLNRQNDCDGQVNNQCIPAESLELLGILMTPMPNLDKVPYDEKNGDT